MFDTIIHKQTEFVPTTVHHHEHRAPTDKSVELLKEMESAAQKKLISSTRLEDNLLKAEWFVSWPTTSPCKNIAIRIRINGQEHIIESEIPYSLQSEDEVADFVYKKIAERMSAILTSQIMSESRKSRAL